MRLPSGVSPSVVVAVHLNYASRAAQRGRTPTEPSYFLKPPSSVSAGGPVVRPRGAELLAYEGEIAIIIGAEAVRDVDPDAGARAIGWYAPADDFGVHDFRWADRGSNLLAKGRDGYTPIGPAVAAADVDPAALVLRARVNGEIVQEGRGDELLFAFGALVADLSRSMTLRRGDVILTGTPAGGGVVVPGDVVEVELEGVGSVTSTIVDADRPLAAYGAMPRATPEARAYAMGVNAPRPVTLDAATEAALRTVSTATLTVQLARRGILDTFLGGLRPTRPDLRLLGYAHTLRYVALREDVRQARAGGEDAQKLAVETTSPGDVLVMEARGERGAGTIGDILAARILARGGAGVVTDGGVRDTPGVGALELPTYFQLPHAASLWSRHIPLDVDAPITCAGVLVMPGDVIAGDAEGVVVVPAALAEEVARDALEHEEREAWALERVHAGESIRGVYPLADARRAEYEAWRSTRSQEGP